MPNRSAHIGFIHTINYHLNYLVHGILPIRIVWYEVQERVFIYVTGRNMKAICITKEEGVTVLTALSKVMSQATSEFREPVNEQ